MKTKFQIIGALTSLIIFTSCHDDSPAPSGRATVVLPLKMEQEDYSREFVFDAEQRLVRIKSSSIFTGEVISETVTECFYNSSGKVDKMVSDNGYLLKYTYDADRIVRTDEYLHGNLSRYAAFTYDEEGRVHDYVLWQDADHNTEFVPVTREIYLYDANGNLSQQLHYEYNTTLRAHELATSYEFSQYDDKVQSESAFNGYSFNPSLVVAKNNPGKMVSTNRDGQTGLIEVYQYLYDARGFITEKTTTAVHAHNGSGGSYKTRYTYQER